MAMVVVDDSCLQADSQPKSGGLVWGSTAACALRCIHQMNRVNSRNSTINIVLGLLLLLLLLWLWRSSRLRLKHSADCRRTLLLSAFICHRSLSVSMIATKCFPLQKRLVCNVNTRNDYITWNIINPRQTINSSDYGSKRRQVPPRFELGSLDSKSRVLTITPWDHRHRHHRCKVVVLQYRWTTQVVDKMHPLKRNFFFLVLHMKHG